MRIIPDTCNVFMSSPSSSRATITRPLFPVSYFLCSP